MNIVGTDYWYHSIGANIIPTKSMSKEPKVEWSEWQQKSIPYELYEKWKKIENYNDGCAVITGKIWRGPHKDKYLVCFDFDNSIAIETFLQNTYSLFGCKSLDELSTKNIVEEHADAKGIRAHVYLITSLQITKHNGLIGDNDPTVPKIEVKSEGSTYMVCSPTIHKDGHPYKIIGTDEPLVLDDQQSKHLEKQIVRIYHTHNLNAANVNSNLPSELRLVAKTLNIGKNSTKISKGCRSNTLISFARVVLNYHYKKKDIQDLREFVAEVNQKLCDPPLSEDELRSIWNRDVVYLLKDLEEGKDFGNGFNDENKERLPRNKDKTKFLTYKYTFKGQLYEAVILGGRPFFLTIKNCEAILESFLEEETRILRPPALEEYPSYTAYTFQEIDEVKKYIDLIISLDNSFDHLVRAVREQISKYIVHHEHILDYITALILFSYFQDKFPTVPYSMFVSDNGSGKSTIGNVFECFGYRCINMTDPTTANIFRIFGTVEAGQCSLVLDEAEKIDQDRDMMSILKTGYENGKKVQRINPVGKQEHFHTFGLKTMLAERSPNPFHAKGVLDRTFIISNFKGGPQLDIKETKISEKGKTEFSLYKNLLLVYRLMHFADNIQDIDTRLQGRDKELCKPLLQLFFNTDFQPKLEKALEILLDEKNTRKANSLEREILEVIIDLNRKEHTDGIIPIPELWDEIMKKTNSTRNQFDESNVISESHGTISKNSLLKMVRDRFGAKEKRYSSVRCLCFEFEKIVKNYEDYVKEEKPTKIVCKPINNDDANDANDANIESLFNSFIQAGNSTSTVNEIQLGDRFPKTNGQNELDKNFEHTNSPIYTKGLENSVIPVIPVIENQMTNPEQKDNLEQEQINHANNIRHKWESGDIWVCENCNDNGDKWHMLNILVKTTRKNSIIYMTSVCLCNSFLQNLIL